MADVDRVDGVSLPGFELRNAGVAPDPLSLERVTGTVDFGVLDRIHDVVGRMPETVILDTRGGEPEVVSTDEGESPGDRPGIGTLVEAVEGLQEPFVLDGSFVDCYTGGQNG